ncbi:hypothetical protein LTR05_000555 [Lithohypha guttulata]|uniref:Uncharacterized protein n=1 Tax=Lithohypha guttulata TaxID=1690604 RepID=A0AAN7T5F0_9EURO|nr:hypothetical protein LTR05_000555 [Lithohypha guttulata]
MAAKMPTPPPHGPIPVNYINDMPDVPVTPARRVARYHSDEYIPRAETDYEKREISPVSANVSDPHTHETIRIYSPEIVQQQNAAPVMPQAPLASIPPLRGMNTQRRASPDYDTAAPSQQRRDSGTGMGTFGSPFQTPEKKPTIVNRHTPSMYATYHDASTLHSPEDQQPIPQTLTPARYDPKANLAPSAAATLASSRLSKAHQGLPSQQQSKPTIPARPEARQQMRPETQYSEFNFDHGLDHDDEPESPIGSPPREAYKSQAVSNPYTQPRANPTSTFDSMIPAAPSSQFDKSKQDKHATNATTFTTMLKNVGFPDPGDQLGKGVPKVPKLDMSKVNGKQAWM